MAVYSGADVGTSGIMTRRATSFTRSSTSSCCKITVGKRRRTLYRLFYRTCLLCREKITNGLSSEAALSVQCDDRIARESDGIVFERLCWLGHRLPVQRHLSHVL